MSTLFTDFFVKINQMSPLEHSFTEVLDTIALTPKLLYFRGEMPKNVSKNGKSVRPKTVAIVGSRHNTKYGEEVAYRLAYKLAKRGVVVVSGLAYGIDTIAHRGCLDAGGVTVAVLGTPIDRIYPRAHEPVARQIIKQGGVIISEYTPSTSDNINISGPGAGSTANYTSAPLAPGEAGFDGVNWIGFKPNQADTSSDCIQEKSLTATLNTHLFVRRRVDQKQSFLYRNRLISGLSDIVVVVEAAERSGTLNTATHALEQGKTVFAVPGNITSPYSRGCNRLIREGAVPYTSPDDVLWSLFPEDYVRTKHRLKQKRLIGDNDVESLILQSIADGVNSGDDIMKSAKLPPEVFGSAITLLEIKGRVSSLGMNNWTLNP